MSIFGLPLILFKVGAKGKLSDIEFLAIKEYGTDGTDSKRVDVDNTVSISNSTTETDIATQTANTGKDMYLGGVTLHVRSTSSTGAQNNLTVRVRINGVAVETYEVDDLSTIAVNEGTLQGNIPLISKGDKVATGQIIKVTAQHSSADANNNAAYTAKLILWEETTGETPQIPSI